MGTLYHSKVLHNLYVPLIVIWSVAQFIVRLVCLFSQVWEGQYVKAVKAPPFPQGCGLLQLILYPVYITSSIAFDLYALSLLSKFCGTAQVHICSRHNFRYRVPLLSLFLTKP